MPAEISMAVHPTVLASDPGRGSRLLACGGEGGRTGRKMKETKLTWWIGAAVGEEDGESVDAGEYHEEPESKGENDGPSLERSELQFHHMWDWKDENGDIGNDRRSSVRSPSANLIGTMSWKSRVPNFLDWDTDEDEDEDDGDDPSNDECTNDISPNSKTWEGKDAVVQEEEGQLRPDQVDDI